VKYQVICKLLSHQKAKIARALSIFPRTLALGSFALLVACAGAEDTSELPSSAPTVSIETASPKITSVPRPEAATPDVTAPAPEALIGLKPVELSETFGAASLVRRDRGAEIWQYRARECVLFLFLYTKSVTDTSDGLRVRHIDVRGGQNPTDCVKTIVRERGSSGQG